MLSYFNQHRRALKVRAILTIAFSFSPGVQCWLQDTHLSLPELYVCAAKGRGDRDMEHLQGPVVRVLAQEIGKGLLAGAPGKE